MPLFILFILLPIMELVTFIKVGGNIGVLWTLFWIFFTGVAGITIIRLQGVATLLSVRERLNEGTIPAKELLKGFFLAMAGVLLVIPGFITDAFGVFLLVPWVSALLASHLLKQEVFVAPQRHHYKEEKDVSDVVIVERYRVHQQQSGETIEGEYKRED